LKSTLPFKHRYFSNYPIKDAKDALWFSKEITHSILDLLWQAGPTGLTPTEVLELLSKKQRNTNRSAVYQTLRGLYELDIVDREWDNSVRAHRNIMKGEFMPAYLDEEYEDWINDEFGGIIEQTLFPAFVKCFGQILTMIRENKVKKKNDFPPIEGKIGWCGSCGSSHQADMFFMSLLYFAAENFIDPASWEYDNEELRKAVQTLYENHGLADPNRDKELEKFR